MQTSTEKRMFQLTRFQEEAITLSFHTSKSADQSTLMHRQELSATMPSIDHAFDSFHVERCVASSLLVTKENKKKHRVVTCMVNETAHKLFQVIAISHETKFQCERSLKEMKRLIDGNNFKDATNHCFSHQQFPLSSHLIV